MKRRVILACLTLLCSVALITGCGKKGEEANKKTEKTEETTEPEIKKEEITYDWSENELVEGVPLPDTDETYIKRDDDREFYVQVSGGEEDVKKYIDRCVKSSFNLEIEQDDVEFTGFNKDGRKLSVRLDGTQYSIGVEPSLIEGEMSWPTNDLVSLIPPLDITVGKLSIDEPDYLFFYAGKVTLDEYTEYVDKCIKMGFTNEESRSKRYFSALNDAGDELTVSYMGVETIAVSIITSDYEI